MGTIASTPSRSAQRARRRFSSHVPRTLPSTSASVTPPRRLIPKMPSFSAFCAFRTGVWNLSTAINALDNPCDHIPRTPHAPWYVRSTFHDRRPTDGRYDDLLVPDDFAHLARRG